MENRTIINNIINKPKKGGFKHDGSVHYSGIRNEVFIVNLLNNNKDNDIYNNIEIDNKDNNNDNDISKFIKKDKCLDSSFIHSGGTKTKHDILLINNHTKEELYTLSIKNHKNKGGTFDWLNSTKYIPLCLQDIIKNEINIIKQNFNGENLDIIKNQINNLFSNCLENIKYNNDIIRNILTEIYYKYSDGIIINYEKNKKIIYFAKENLKELQTYDDNIYYLKHTEGNTSAQIMRIYDNRNISTNLRVRLVLNNGVNALFGKSKCNKTSTPCIKIQQDNVDNLIDNINDKIIQFY